MLLYIIIGYLIVALLVSTLAVGRRMSVAGAFIISFFLTPLTGLLAILNTDKKVKITHYTNCYYCPRCHSKFKSNDDYCPNCLSEGVKIKPEKIVSKPEIKFAL